VGCNGDGRPELIQKHRDVTARAEENVPTTDDHTRDASHAIRDIVRRRRIIASRSQMATLAATTLQDETLDALR